MAERARGVDFGSMYAHPSSMYAPRHNPLLGTGLAVVGVLGATAAGAWIAKALIGHSKSLTPTGVLRPSTGPGGIPSKWMAEVSAALVQGATLKDGGIMAGPPFALNVRGIAGVEGPTQQQFPYVTQPEAFWIRSKDGVAVPMLSLYTAPDGEVGLQMDLDQMGGKGIVIDEGQVIYADGTVAGTMDQTDHLITNLNPQLAQSAYAIAGKRIAEHGDAYDVPSGTRDAYVREVLSQWVPSFDWNAAPDNIPNNLGTWVSSVALLWLGVSLVGQVRYQNHWNDRR